MISIFVVNGVNKIRNIAMFGKLEREVPIITWADMIRKNSESMGNPPVMYGLKRWFDFQIFRYSTSSRNLKNA